MVILFYHFDPKLISNGYPILMTIFLYLLKHLAPFHRHNISNKKKVFNLNSRPIEDPGPLDPSPLKQSCQRVPGRFNVIEKKK